MTEAEAVAGINADATAAVALTTALTGDFNGFDSASGSLVAALSALDAQIAKFEANMNYAIQAFLPTE